jgi:hypothetical protein
LRTGLLAPRLANSTNQMTLMLFQAEFPSRVQSLAYNPSGKVLICGDPAYLLSQQKGFANTSQVRVTHLVESNSAKFDQYRTCRSVFIDLSKLAPQVGLEPTSLRLTADD